MAKREWVNSSGTTFKSLPTKDRAPFGEYWVQVTRANGTTEGVGQFDNSFSGFDEAEKWIEQNMDKSEYL